MSEKLWGGRFKKKIDLDFYKFQKSIEYDYKLAKYDLVHSLIHIKVLCAAGVLSRSEMIELRKAIMEIKKDLEDNKTYKYNPDSEDIHTDIHNKVAQKYPALADKLHTLRSRNDQVAFDEQYYCLDKSNELIHAIKDVLQKNLSGLAVQYKNQRFIGYTHTQRAQVVEFKDYIGAFMQMFARDQLRLQAFFNNLYAYIGAGALAGTSLEKEDYGKAVKDDKSLQDFPSAKIKPVKNTLDNVSGRDFIVEFLSILSIVQMHLSRLAEDFILYSTKEFNYIELPEEFCTGSSLMPHKKNPDFLELVRGNTGKVYGNLISVLTTMKGLPLTYNRDMQLDKEPLFSSVETVKNELKIMARFIKGIKLNKKVIDNVIKEDIALYATAIAEYLVRQGKVPFKKAHDIVGRLTRYIEDIEIRGLKHEITDVKLRSFHPMITKKIINKIMRK